MIAKLHRILIDGQDSNLNNPTTKLRIVWGKAFNEVYCHHALLEFSSIQSTLFSPKIAKVSVLMRDNMIEKGQVSSFSESRLTRYLPVTQMSSILTIPLNSPDILDALCENGWTKLKGGERGAPKSFPLSMEIEMESYPRCEINFKHEEGKYPYTLSELYFESLSNGEKVETIIEIK